MNDSTPRRPSPLDAEALAADPRTLPFLPLLYIAWADGELSDVELDSIREAIRRSASLDAERRSRLEAWLKPDEPPPPARIQDLLAAIQTRARKLPAARRVSLAQLGSELAGGAESGVRASLDEIEDALGIAGAEMLHEFLPGSEPALRAPRAASFQPFHLRDMLQDGSREVRERVFTLLGRTEFRREYGISTQRRRERVLDWLRILADEGLGAIAYPREYGGEDDMAGFLAVFETLACFELSLTIKYGVQFGLFGGSIRALGTERHHRRYLARAGSLELPGCFAMTELGHGSNVAGIETEACYDPETAEFVVHTPSESARKEYIGNAALHGRLAVVFARLKVGGHDHGVHALVVPIRNEDGSTAAGVSIEDCGEKLGLNGVDNGRIRFDRVRVPRENLLNRFADVSAEGEYASPIASPSKRFFTVIGSLVAGRVSVALAALSAMKSGLAIAVRYGERRRQFGPPGEAEVTLLDYRTHQRRLLPRLAAAYALHFALRRLGERFVRRGEGEQREIEALAAGLKAYATWCNIETLQVCRESCGGQGYLAVNRFADLKADSDVFATFEGDNTVLMQLVAKSLLSERRREFEDIRPFPLLKYAAQRAVDAVGEPNPVAARLTDAEHLRDAEFQLGAFRYRERRLLSSAARRLRHRIDEGEDSFRALNDCQDHLLALAEAHVETLVCEAFAEAVEACQDEAVRAVLGKLRDLWALWRIERDRAWFLEAGYISSGKSQAIRAEVNALCAELRPEAAALVDAFGIPDGILGAPIAAAD